MKYIVGLDVGQAQDFTALSVLERDVRPSGRRDQAGREEWEDHYTVRRLRRPQLKTAYPDVVRLVAETLALPKLAGGETSLIVDATGVGRPIVDMLREADLHPVPVTITGGREVTNPDGYWHVPKRELVSSMALALQTQRLHVVRTVEHADTLAREMLAFKVKIKTTAHESYEAWREGDHDDLVLSVALAVWWGERQREGSWRGAEPDAKERRRRQHMERHETPWWRRRTPADRGETAGWRRDK